MPSIEFKMLREEILRRDKGVRIVFLCKMLDKRILSRLSYCVHIFVQMYHIATAKIVLLDSYCIPVSILKHKKKLKVIQMWHSIGTMKKFGYTALDTKEGSKYELAYTMKMHRNYDYIFASSDAYKEDLARGFNYSVDKIITMPLPRVDLLKSSVYARRKKEEILKKYPDLKAKPIILYCPTFRKDEREFRKALSALNSALEGKEFNFVIKLHPLSKTELPAGSYAVPKVSSFDMIFAADYIISDYSCIIYEAALRNLPLFFYNFDMNIYEESRGLAIDYYRELPGFISQNAEEIVGAIENHKYDLDKVQAFAEKYICPVHNATKNIVNFIFQIKNQEE